jgi:hypothetical protein
MRTVVGCQGLFLKETVINPIEWGVGLEADSVVVVLGIPARSQASCSEAEEN